MSDCIFCRIGAGELPSEKLYEDEDVFAIKDLHPAAPTHVLIIPRRHVATLLDLDAGDGALVAKVFHVAAGLARKLGFAETGYRVVANCNRDGGQTVYHIHFHFLAGRPLGWPPG